MVNKKDDTDESLSEAKQAARNGDALRMVEALHKSFALDGLVRRLCIKWPRIPETDIDYAVAESVDVLYQAIAEGKTVINVVSYMWKVADRKASDYNRLRQREVLKDSDDLANIRNAVAINKDEPLIDQDEIDRSSLQKKAITLARSFVSKLGQQNIQAVMNYVIDAVEAGREDVPNGEISEALGLSSDTVRTSLSRGFRRLERVAQDSGVVLRNTGLRQPEEDIDDDLLDNM